MGRLARSLTRREDWPRDAVGVRRPSGQPLPRCRRRHATALNWGIAAATAAKPMAYATTGLCQTITGVNGVDLQLLDQSEDRTQQRLQLSDYCPLLWRAWLGHLTQGIENGELKEQLNHAVVALIHGGSGSVSKHSHPRTA